MTQVKINNIMNMDNIQILTKKNKTNNQPLFSLLEY